MQTPKEIIHEIETKRHTFPLVSDIDVFNFSQFHQYF